MKPGANSAGSEPGPEPERGVESEGDRRLRRARGMRRVAMGMGIGGAALAVVGPFATAALYAATGVIVAFGLVGVGAGVAALGVAGASAVYQRRDVVGDELRRMLEEEHPEP